MRADPAKKAEVAARMKGKQATFPLATPLEQGKWYSMVVETVGDEMRVSIDGQPAGYLKSGGNGHPTKSKIELGVAGKDGWFEDLRCGTLCRRRNDASLWARPAIRCGCHQDHTVAESAAGTCARTSPATISCATRNGRESVDDHAGTEAIAVEVIVFHCSIYEALHPLSPIP